MINEEKLLNKTEKNYWEIDSLKKEIKSIKNRLEGIDIDITDLYYRSNRDPWTEDSIGEICEVLNLIIKKLKETGIEFSAKEDKIIGKI